MIDERKYIAELTKLLAFMSSWDRQAAVARYEELFDAAQDPEALIEELGTPTRVAVELANGYVSSPPPAGFFPPAEAREAEEPAPAPPAAAEEEPAEGGDDAAQEPPEQAEPPEAPRSSGFRALFWLFALVPGLPVTVLLACIGVPFLVAGIGMIYSTVRALPASFGSFSLFSDVLLLTGAGLGLLAVGLLLAWFGLWLSVSLCRLWLDGVLFPLGKKARGARKTI